MELIATEFAMQQMANNECLTSHRTQIPVIETMKRLLYRGGTNTQDSQECSLALWSEARFL